MEPTLNVAPVSIANFATLGDARFTIENTRTGNRFTYWVQACEDKTDLFFVKVLTGSDNDDWRCYSYLGTIRTREIAGCAETLFSYGRKSRISADAKSVIALAWTLGHADKLPDYIKVWHEGRCGRCGRVLTTPESIERGIGPICIEKSY